MKNVSRNIMDNACRMSALFYYVRASPVKMGWFCLCFFFKERTNKLFLITLVTLFAI